MSALLKHQWNAFPESWALSIQHFPEIHGGCFVVSSSNGALALYSLDNSKQHGQPLFINRRAHESSINALLKIDEFTLASAATDGIKIWDLRDGLNRAQVHLSHPKKSNFLSLASARGHLLAAGTELVGTDAEVLLWDLKNPGKIVRSFVDSHHDDITALEFHPLLPYLMSGSTDGYVNIYNLDEPDEEEALHQVINFASVHLCHFIRPTRISVLSHMETLEFCELNSTNYEEAEEPQPKELGDLRSIWPDCEYVVDISLNGYVAYGANLKLSLTIVPFDALHETFDLLSLVAFSPAHGEEVVRDVCFVPGTTLVLTCGEDGTVKAWEVPCVVSGKASAATGISGESVDCVRDGSEEKEKQQRRKEKIERKEKKDKEKRDKKEKKEKRKKLKGDVRFKPY